MRDLPRSCMVLVGQRTQLKNRIHATLAKYGLSITEVKDNFGKRGRAILEQRIAELPPHTRHTTKCLLAQLDSLATQSAALQERIGQAIAATPEMELLQSIPGVGPILSVVIASGIGKIERFHRPGQLASYAGTTPRVHSSGGKTRHGRLRPDVNRYLNFAFIEAANSAALHAKRHPTSHISRLYMRIKKKKGHAKAAGAVARHLAEATFWMLTKKEPYKKPASPTRG